MALDMKTENIDVDVLITRLEDVLHFLDESDLAMPAIKIEEALNALKQVDLDRSKTPKHDK